MSKVDIEVREIKDILEKADPYMNGLNTCARALYKAGYRKQSEVVHCKDCRHRYSLGDDTHCCRIAHGMNGIVAEEDYCSYGRKK